VRVQDLEVDGVQNVTLSSQAGEEGQVTSETEVDIERTRLGVHASSEHDVNEVFLLFEMVTVIDDSVIDDLTEQTNG